MSKNTRRSVKQIEAQLAKALEDGDAEAIIGAVKSILGTPNVAAATMAPTVTAKAAGTIGASRKARQKAPKVELATPVSYFTSVGSKPGFVNLYLYAEEQFAEGEKSTAGYPRGSEMHELLVGAGFKFSKFHGRWWGAASELPEAFGG